MNNFGKISKLIGKTGMPSTLTKGRIADKAPDATLPGAKDNRLKYMKKTVKI